MDETKDLFLTWLMTYLKSADSDNSFIASQETCVNTKAYHEGKSNMCTDIIQAIKDHLKWK